jgi:hypothetical protein
MTRFPFIIVAVAALSGCAPSTFQKWTTYADEKGRVVQHAEGYTKTGEVAKGDGRRYFEKLLSATCPDGFIILQAYETPSGNGFGDFLHWSGDGRCKNGGPPKLEKVGLF